MSGTAAPTSHGGKYVRWITALVALALLAAVIILAPRYLDWDVLVEQEATLRAAIDQRPWMLLAVAFPIYVVLVTFALPGMPTFLAFACGWLVGFWPGVAIVSMAATSGAACMFLLSRYLFRDAVQKFLAQRWPGVAEAADRQGVAYLLSMRLLPATPFSIFNLIMGLSRMRLATYWLVTQLGQLPGTCLYVYAGSQLPPLADLPERGVRGVLTPQIIAAMVALSLLPWVARAAIKRWRADPPNCTEPASAQPKGRDDAARSSRP